MDVSGIDTVEVWNVFSPCLLSQEEHYFVVAIPRRIRDVWKDQNPTCIYLGDEPWRTQTRLAETQFTTQVQAFNSNLSAFGTDLAVVCSEFYHGGIDCYVWFRTRATCGAFLMELQLHASSCLLPSYNDLLREFTWKHLANSQKLYNVNSIANQWSVIILCFWEFPNAKNFTQILRLQAPYCSLCISKVPGTEKTKSFLHHTLGSITESWISHSCVELLLRMVNCKV